MESNQQAWRMRFSYRNATIVVCFFNIVFALLLLRGFLAAVPGRGARRGQADPELMQYILESEEIRHAMEPLELIKRVRELERDRYTEPEGVQPIVPKKTAAADLSKRLQDFRTMNDANNQKALEEWRKRKIERERARQRDMTFLSRLSVGEKECDEPHLSFSQTTTMSSLWSHSRC